MIPRTSRLLYGATALASAGLYLLLLYEPLRGLRPEVDLWWMMPAFSHYLEGRAGWGLWAFLMGPAPSYFAFPSHKLMLWLLHVLGLPLGAWSWAAALIHAANAFLLAWLCRMLGLSRRASWITGITYLSLFVHFHAIVWLPGSQHVLTLFTILGTLLLFLTTERRIRKGREIGWTYGLTLLFLVAASIQNAALLAPLLMAAYILAHPAPPRDRYARYLRWVPAFAAATLYPIGSHSFSYVKPLISVVAEVPLSPWLKASLLSAVVAGFLALGGVLLRAACISSRWGRRIRILMGGAGLSMVLFLVIRDSRQALLPYNALIPFITTLSSFLDPFGAALSIDSAMQYHYVAAGISPASCLLGVFLLAVFAAAVLRYKRRFLLFGVWYAAILLYLLLHRHVASSMPFHLPSRYFMYVTPIACVLLCPAAVVLCLRLARRMGWRGWGVDAALVLLFAFFWVPNLLAARVALLRGRLAATYYIVDDLWAVQTIQEDLRRNRKDLDPAGTTVAVTGITPMAYKRKWDWPVPAERVQYRLFRQLAEETWRTEAPIREILVNEGPSAERGARLYRIKGDRLSGPDGLLDEFAVSFDAGVKALSQRRYAEAGKMLEAAARRRPFLLNYILTPEGRLSDLSRVIAGADLNDWLTRLGYRDRRWSIAPSSKWEHVDRFIRSQCGDYRRCLLYLAYARWKEARYEESLFWLSRLRFLESDADWLAAGILQDPLLRGDPAAAPFLSGLADSLKRRDSLPWRKNDYAFGRWLARILLRWDIRSRWDQQFPEPP